MWRQIGAKVHSDSSSHTGQDPHLERLAPPPVLLCRNNSLSGYNEAVGIGRQVYSTSREEVQVGAGVVQSGGEAVILLHPGRKTPNQPDITN